MELCSFSQAYQTIRGDQKRYQDRIDEISTRPLKGATEEPATSIQSEPPGEQLLSTDFSDKKDFLVYSTNSYCMIS